MTPDLLAAACDMEGFSSPMPLVRVTGAEIRVHGHHLKSSLTTLLPVPHPYKIIQDVSAVADAVQMVGRSL